MGIRCVTSECNLDLDLLRIELKINEIETSYIIIHKIYFIFCELSNLEAQCGRIARTGPRTALPIGCFPPKLVSVILLPPSPIYYC